MAFFRFFFSKSGQVGFQFLATFLMVVAIHASPSEVRTLAVAIYQSPIRRFLGSQIPKKTVTLWTKKKSRHSRWPKKNYGTTGCPEKIFDKNFSLGNFLDFFLRIFSWKFFSPGHPTEKKILDFSRVGSILDFSPGEWRFFDFFFRKSAKLGFNSSQLFYW